MKIMRKINIVVMATILFALPGSSYAENIEAKLSAGSAFQVLSGTKVQMHVGANGNVGIGTTNPQYKLDVAGTIRAQAFEGLTSQAAQFNNVEISGGLKVGSSSIILGRTRGGGADNTIRFENLSGVIETDGKPLTINAGATGNIILNPTSTGNVGIGTTSPGQKLSVVGTVESTSGGFRFPDGTVQITAMTGGIPTGGIIMWFGSIASIPSGWALCDGNNGTPNLMDKFIVGAGNSYNVDTSAVAPTHAHGAGSYTASNHTHTGNASSNTSGSRLVDDNSGGQNYMVSDESHVHSLTINTGGGSISGNSNSTTSLPPYYALAYIMRL